MHDFCSFSFPPSCAVSVWAGYELWCVVRRESEQHKKILIYRAISKLLSQPTMPLLAILHSSTLTQLRGSFWRNYGSCLTFGGGLKVMRIFMILISNRNSRISCLKFFFFYVEKKQIGRVLSEFPPTIVRFGFFSRRVSIYLPK